MKNFIFSMPTQIYFGKGNEYDTAKILKQRGAKNVLLHYGGGSIKKSGLLDIICRSLKHEGIAYTELGGVLPNPRLKIVYEGIDICRKKDIDFILAAGGGSVINSAKAIALGAFYKGDVWDFFIKHTKPQSKVLPIGVVLTIPAAGSESSPNLVISKEDEGLKRSYKSALIRPQFALLNPELCYTLPKEQISYGIADIMAHMLERYFTTDKDNYLTDKLLESGMKTVIKYAPKVLENPADYQSWAQIMWTGCICHNDTLSCGRTGDWASHALEHEISAIYDVAHGAGLAVVMPAWMKYVYKKDTELFSRFARNVFGINSHCFNEEKTALKGIAALESFFESINLSTDAKALKIDGGNFEKMALKLLRFDENGHTGNFVKLYKQDIINIYKLTIKST